VRHQHDGLAEPLLNPPELDLELCTRHGIERAEWFVHQHDGRIRRKRARHADALALTSRQLMRPSIDELVRRKSDEIEKLRVRAAIRSAGHSASVGTTPTLRPTLMCGNSPTSWRT
jgi:hypothetical protein